jgi:hypothetical protein
MTPEIHHSHGMKYAMYSRNEHAAPHVHVYYGGACACIAVRSLRITAGNLPVTQTALAKAWIKAHREELLTMWDNRLKPGGIYYIED